MSKYNNLFGAVLSTLLFSGAAIADGVTDENKDDILTGHSSDHQDPVLNNPGKSKMPEMGHTNEKDGDDLIHKITVHNEELSSSPSSPPDQHHSSDDNAPSIVHEVTDHK